MEFISWDNYVPIFCHQLLLWSILNFTNHDCWKGKYIQYACSCLGSYRINCSCLLPTMFLESELTGKSQALFLVNHITLKEVFARATVAPNSPLVCDSCIMLNYRVWRETRPDKCKSCLWSHWKCVSQPIIWSKPERSNFILLVCQSQFPYHTII